MSMLMLNFRKLIETESTRVSFIIAFVSKSGHSRSTAGK